MRVVDHIVVAVDFSEPSRIAVRAAMQVARMANTKKLTLLHALRHTVLPHGDVPELRRRLVELRDRTHVAARNQMAEMIGTDPVPFEVEYQIVEGTPARVIPPAARDLGGTMLALGTHARRGVTRLLKGSVVESMLHRLHLPTLVFSVGDDQIPPETELAALSHVTVAIDTHDGADLVARRAKDALSVLSSQKPAVTLMTVVDVNGTELAPDESLITEVHDMVREETGRRLAPLQAEFVEAGFQTNVEIRTGTVEDEILAVAANHPSQLIVMGTHGTGDVLLDFSSTAADVIRYSNVTVLVFPSHKALHEEA